MLGSIYALIALGYTMVYGILRIINFAHGDILMVGALTTLSGMHALNAHFPTLPPLAQLGLALLLAMTGFGRLSDTAEAAQAVIRDADRSLPDPEHHYLYADNLGNSSNYTAGIQSSLARSHLTEVEHPSDGLIENQ